MILVSHASCEMGTGEPLIQRAQQIDVPAHGHWAPDLLTRSVLKVRHLGTYACLQSEYISGQAPVPRRLPASLTQGPGLLEGTPLCYALPVGLRGILQ